MGFTINKLRFCYYLYVIYVGSISHAHYYQNSYYMEDYCSGSEAVLSVGSNGSSSSYGYLRATPNQFYSQNITCQLTLEAPENKRITLRFVYVDIYNEMGYSYGYCQLDYLTLAGESGQSYNFCYYKSYIPPFSHYSSGRSLTFTFTTFPESQIRKGFSLYYTVYSFPPCSNSEYYCYYLGRCIPNELKCDGHDNCGDWTDEGVAACGLGVAAIVTISIFCSLAAIAIVLFIVYCLTDMKKRKKATREQNQVNPDFSTAVYHSNSSGQRSYGEPPPPHLYSNEGFVGNADVGYTAGAAGGNVTFTMSPSYEDVVKEKENEPPNYVN